MTFINSFQSEWLKKKRSLASWLVLAGAVFTPSIILIARIKNYDKLPALYASDDFWQKLWNQSWESMAVILLPMGVILATSLILQLEYKNNTWKQLHTTPQTLTTIFLAKLAVLLTMMAGLFILFNVGIFLSAVIPAMLFKDVSYPLAGVPYANFLNENLKYFVDCLPILALQYLLGLQYKNFLVPVGVGFVVWVLGIGVLSWEYSFIFPYNQCVLDFLMSSGQLGNRKVPPVNLQLLAAVYFVAITIVSYALYLTKKEKG
jgi:hypothetical protein